MIIRSNLLRILFTFSWPFALLAQNVQPGVQTPGDFERPVSWKLLIPNILSDQGKIWLFPGRIAQDHNWIPTLSILGGTAALIPLDPYAGKYFHTTSSYSGFNRVFSSNATDLGMLVAPLSLYAAGVATKNPKMQHTMLLAGEAAADAEILTTVLKDVDRRLRPATFGPNKNYWDSWFDSRGSWVRGNGSFPSGHTIAAFSIATVVARRYRTHRWVPYVSYGLASAVGFSRLTLSAHFTSDVFAGAALGYVISRYAVLRQ